MTITAILAAVLSAPQSPPPPSTGLFMDMPITIMKDESAEIWIAHPGAPAQQLAELEDRFLLATMLPDLNQDYFLLNSFSRGTGLMTTEMTAPDEVTQTVPDGGWSFIVYGVSGSDWPAGIYAVEEDALGGVQGDIFSYVDPGSEDYFPPEGIGVIRKSRDGLEMDATATGLRGLDTYMAGYLLGDDIPGDIGIEGTVFYFTVVLKPGSSGSYDDLPDAWAGGASNWKGPATVFSVDYLGGKWQTPTVFKTPLALNLPIYQPGTTDLTVIDGLSVMDSAASAEVLLSTTDDNLEKQLWVVGTWWYDFRSVTYGGPLLSSTGNLYVEEKLQIAQQKGVRSICCDDPGPMDGPSPRHIQRNTRMALVVTDPLSGSPNLDFAAHRVRSGQPGTDLIRFTLQGFVSSSDRIGRLVMSGLWANRVVGTVTRNPLNTSFNTVNTFNTGDRRVLTLPVPNVAVGGEVTFQWLIYGRTGFVGASRVFYLYFN